MSEAPDFVHLRTRTHYSLLTATADVGDMVAAAAADGQKALALTDNGNLFGAVEFYKACKEKGLRSVLGLTAYVAGKSMREPTSAENPSHDLTLLAATQEGWDNLRLLSSRSWLEGFSYRPRIDLDLLAKHGKGLIVLSGSTAGEVASAILKNDGRGAMAAAARLRDIVGQDNFFLEVAETGYEPQRRATSGLKRIGQELGIPCVATNDVHYLKPEHWLAQDIALCIRNGRSVADQDRQRMGSRELYLRTRAEMARAFSGWEDVLHQTVAIADRCSVKLEFGVYHVPVFQPDTGESPDDHFARRCREGAIMRYGQLTEEVTKRLEYEIGVVRKLGFVSYFLIVQDFILKAKSMGIPVGPGRGSAAGSIVAYALEITDVDPLRYNLLFERFLNPGRVSMPDIDIDFCGNRRDEVIRYVREKYGNDCVCQIITFGTMASRGVLRDVGRVLDMDLGEVDKLCKKVPQGPGASLKAALESDPELKQLRESSQQHKRLFDLSLNLEGLARHSSIHAAGVVIADKPLVEYVPLSKNGEDVTTQWQMTELEEVGLLKMDFLGLKTLTILQEAVRLVKEVHGVDIDLGKLPLDDAPTYAIMTRGETQGIFQLESSGMRELLTRLKPDTFEDVIAVLALYRPGPLGSGMVDMFVRRKHGQEEVVYEHESLRPLLEATYGVIVYQEQVMQIANVVGAFSMADADNLRKAMGKKKPEVMAKFKEQFVQGAKGLGYDEKFARQLFETMEYFAGYGFNKSHSTAYALLTYQTAWLKAHYPLEFTAANMTVESGNSDKIKEFVDDTRRSGIRLLPPHVNHSAAYFNVEHGAIRYGLGAVKGIGTRAAALLAEDRQRNGTYDSLENLCERLDSTLLNKTALEALAMAGAFDGLGRSRKATMDSIESAMRSSAVTRGPTARPEAAVRRTAFVRHLGNRCRNRAAGTRRRVERPRAAREREGCAGFLPVRAPVRETRQLPATHRGHLHRHAQGHGPGLHPAHRGDDQLRARAPDQAGQERRPEDGSIRAGGPGGQRARHRLRAHLRAGEGPDRRRRDHLPRGQDRRKLGREGAALQPDRTRHRNRSPRGRRPRPAPRGHSHDPCRAGPHLRDRGSVPRQPAVAPRRARGGPAHPPADRGRHQGERRPARRAGHGRGPRQHVLHAAVTVLPR